MLSLTMKIVATWWQLWWRQKDWLLQAFVTWKYFKIRVTTSKLLSMTSSENISLRDWNYIVEMVLWSKFGDSSISMREFIITSILYKKKTIFLKGVSGSSSMILGLILNYAEVTSENLIGDEGGDYPTFPLFG